MAKLSIMGDTVQITTELTKETIKRVSDYAPEALKLFDEEGNEIFGIGVGNASCSKYGICFCSEDANGKLFMTTNNPVTNHADPEKEREEVIRCFAQMLSKLKAVEENVADGAEAIAEIESDVRDSVTFVTVE